MVGSAGSVHGEWMAAMYNVLERDRCGLSWPAGAAEQGGGQSSQCTHRGGLAPPKMTDGTKSLA